MKTNILQKLIILFVFGSLFGYSQMAIDSTKTYTVRKHDGAVFIGRIISQSEREVLINTNNLGRIIIPTHEIKEIVEVESTVTFIIRKYDGAEFIGKIISQNDREVLINTKNLGRIIIPKHEIKEIVELENTAQNLNGEIIAPELFSTRYFITTNALPLKREAYVTWNLFGPEVHFGINKHFGAGIMTTWLAVPVIADLKFSFELEKNLHVGVGTLLGIGSWAFQNLRMAVPFGVITIGNKNANLNFAGGYGYFSNDGKGNGRGLVSVGAMVKVSKSISLVFDSFIMPPTSSKVNISSLAIVIPGLRIQTSDKKAFQFGFTGVNSDTKWVPVPIPMVQWFRRL